MYHAGKQVPNTCWHEEIVPRCIWQVKSGMAEEHEWAWERGAMWRRRQLRVCNHPFFDYPRSHQFITVKREKSVDRVTNSLTITTAVLVAVQRVELCSEWSCAASGAVQRVKHQWCQPEYTLESSAILVREGLCYSQQVSSVLIVGSNLYILCRLLQ